MKIVHLACVLALLAAGCVEGRSAAPAEDRIIVSGASGQLGGMVVEELLARGIDADRLILVSRTPESLATYASLGASTRFGDFNQPESLAAAYAGGDRLLLISMNTGVGSDPDEMSERARLHEVAIRAAVDAGVRHIVYTSFVDAEENPSPLAVDHRATERMLRESGVAWTAMRNQLYMDGLVNAAARMVAAGEAVVVPNRTGVTRAAHVTRRDIARAIAAVLTTDGHENRAYEITGGEVVGPEEVARIVQDLTGVPIRIVGGTGTEPVPTTGSMATVSDAVERLTGRAPTTVRDHLAENREVLVRRP